jgi:predicted TIM-barrel fold metal-dependent hydrolase
VLGFATGAVLRMEPELRLACVQAYNDFQIEFCDVAPDRLIPLANLPWWDVEASVQELERAVAMGHKGLVLGWEAEKLGFPPLRSDHWAPLFRTAEEMSIPVNFHVGFNADFYENSGIDPKGWTSLDYGKFLSGTFPANIRCITELIFGRVCHKYENLKFVSVESGAGYLPYLLDVMDWEFTVTSAYLDYPEMLLPSEYFKRQIYATFWFERHLERFADLFPDNLMFESDYPHSTCLAPQDGSAAKGPRDTILSNMQGLPEELIVKLVHENAAKVYNLD